MYIVHALRYALENLDAARTMSTVGYELKKLTDALHDARAVKSAETRPLEQLTRLMAQVTCAHNW